MIKFYAYIHVQGLGPIPIDFEYDEAFRSLDAASEVTLADLIEQALAFADDEEEEDDDDDDSY